MISRLPARSAKRAPVTSRVAALLLVVSLAVGLPGCQASSPATGEPSSSLPPAEPGHHGSSPEPGEADGILPHGATVLDEDLPGIANLRSDLRNALRRATEDAAERGIEIQVNSGWRSAAYQRRLLEEAISEYGSEEEAARWVATEETSAHVTGEAVDIAPYDAIDWLARRGAAYGLCQIYGNEPWHYELRPEAIDNGCPVMYPDPSHDPRLR